MFCINVIKGFLRGKKNIAKWSEKSLLKISVLKLEFKNQLMMMRSIAVAVNLVALVDLFISGSRNLDVSDLQRLALFYNCFSPTTLD